MSRTPAIIFDRDGTLASLHNAPTEKNDKSWAEYNAAMIFDTPVPVVAGILHAIRPGVARLMTSGRAEGDTPGDRRRLFLMASWLVKHQLPIDRLFMRVGGDRRLDSVVKEEIYRERIEPFYDVRYAIDDRPQVCDLWRSLGIPVMQVVDPGVLPTIGG